MAGNEISVLLDALVDPHQLVQGYVSDASVVGH